MAPYGHNILEWLWGGPSVSDPTLKRFFTLHFIFPIIILILVFVHIYYLHLHTASNPGNNSENSNFFSFSPAYILKDVLIFCFILFWLNYIVSFHPNIFMNPSNFIKANPLKTPNSITPE